MAVTNKYWVPALDRANRILNLISDSSSQLRLTDISKELEINKSTLFTLLNTLESLQWVTKENGGYYSLGPSLGILSASYFKKFDILESFYKEAGKSVSKLNEHIQLGILEGGNVFYLGKIEGDSRVRLITDPGMRYPAYASALGKVQLIQYNRDELEEIFPSKTLEKKTPYTIGSIDELYENILLSKTNGYAIEEQEASVGFHCVAAPIYNFENQIIAGVSFTMTTSSWEKKKEQARKEIIQLAQRLSRHAGNAIEITR